MSFGQDVSLKFVVKDDGATRTLEDIAKGLVKSDSSANKTSKSFEGVAKSSTKMKGGVDQANSSLSRQDKIMEEIIKETERYQKAQAAATARISQSLAKQEAAMMKVNQAQAKVAAASAARSAQIQTLTSQTAGLAGALGVQQAGLLSAANGLSSYGTALASVIGLAVAAKSAFEAMTAPDIVQGNGGMFSGRTNLLVQGASGIESLLGDGAVGKGIFAGMDIVSGGNLGALSNVENEAAREDAAQKKFRDQLKLSDPQKKALENRRKFIAQARDAASAQRQSVLNEGRQDFQFGRLGSKDAQSEIEKIEQERIGLNDEIASITGDTEEDVKKIKEHQERIKSLEQDLVYLQQRKAEATREELELEREKTKEIEEQKRKTEEQVRIKEAAEQRARAIQEQKDRARQQEIDQLAGRFADQAKEAAGGLNEKAIQRQIIQNRRSKAKDVESDEFQVFEAERNKIKEDLINKVADRKGALAALQFDASGEADRRANIRATALQERRLKAGDREVRKGEFGAEERGEAIQDLIGEQIDKMVEGGNADATFKTKALEAFQKQIRVQEEQNAKNEEFAQQMALLNDLIASIQGRNKTTRKKVQ